MVVGELRVLKKEVAALRDAIMAKRPIGDDEGEYSAWFIKELEKSGKSKKTIPHEEVRKMLGL
jgi:hypothetical protein